MNGAAINSTLEKKKSLKTLVVNDIAEQGRI